MNSTLQQYRNTHKWMAIPWLIIFIGFTPQYFMTWLSEPWAYHLHALSAIAWYILMGVQPYLITRGNIKQHRLWGMLGIFIAGAVVFSALSIVPTNVYFGAIGGFEPVFSASFFYGLVLTETLQVIGFGLAVVMAIVNSKKIEEHALWMISTLFFGLMPAWGRLIMFPILITEGEISWLNTQTSLNIGVSIFMLVILYIGYRLKKLKHPAILLSLFLVLLMLFSIQIGELEWYQELVTKIMKPTVPWNI
ncbi:MAG: hypothetical protein MK226_16265 [Saprospiraceae bacterium]|nr:hypothetical protein [Saprospiraceae bacterium]